MNLESTRIGPLDCRIFDDLPDDALPQLVVVLCHGFGAPGDDLVPLGPELLRVAPALSEAVRFIFPAAPLSLDAHGLYGGRAWWLLDLEARLEAIQRGELRRLCSEAPAGLAEAREMLSGFVGELTSGMQGPIGRVVLGGFSQGAMLATDVSLRLPDSPAGLCIFSGTLLCEAEWRELAARRGPLPVLQSHGRQDPLLPFQAAEWLRDMLQQGGLPVEFVPFNGFHTIPPEALERFAVMLQKLARA